MEIHRIKGILTSIYLISYPQTRKLLLLDSGYANDFDLINKTIKSLGYNHNLTLITTHSHSRSYGIRP